MKAEFLKERNFDNSPPGNAVNLRIQVMLPSFCLKEIFAEFSQPSGSFCWV